MDSSIGVKLVFIIWFVTVVIGVFLVNVYGVYQFQYFMQKMETPIITDETIAHVSNLFGEHGSSIWFERKQKIYFQKDLHIQVVQMVNLRKKQILWMFGLIQVLLIKRY